MLTKRVTECFHFLDSLLCNFSCGTYFIDISLIHIVPEEEIRILTQEMYI